MRFRPLAILSCLSLMGFLATVVLWIWSYFTPPAIWFISPHEASGYCAQRGMFWNASWKVTEYARERPSFVKPLGNVKMTDAPLTPGWDGRLGGEFIRVPAILVAVMSLMLPAWWLVLHLGRRRALLDVCAQCGYDLRASPERCPECGTPVPARIRRKVMAAMAKERAKQPEL